MDQVESFIVGELAVKLKSKTEIYNQLSRESKIYLPTNQDATQSYLREIMIENKYYLKWNQVVVFKVPKYKGLWVKEIISFASNHLNITKYLPKYTYEKDSNRECLCNAVNSSLHDEFNEFVDEKVKIRKKRIEKISKHLSISKAWIC